MVEETIFFGSILVAIVVVLYLISSGMRIYILKWLLASLVMPFMVIANRSLPESLVLFFWPGSIMLISLGAVERNAMEIVYVWYCAIILNVGIYFLLGLISYFILHRFKTIIKETNNLK